jgi:FAD/FMN-containing dehydrogenase
VGDERGMSRRRALGLIAGATASGVVAACSGSSSAPSPAHSPGTATPPAPTHSPSANAAPDWTGLRRSLRGSLQQPGAAGYDRSRILFDPRFDHVHPQGVAEVADSADVAECVAFARRYQIPLAVRSGGHSYLGASIGTGLVLDLRQNNKVAIDASGQQATIGGGAALVDVYSPLAASGVSIPAGSCPTVGVSGLALGGGVGVVAREYGLTCDRLIEAEIVTADGQVLTCSASSHPDLYWALRGGGGSFGVVTSLTLGTHPTRQLAHAYVTWPWSAAASVLAAWQRWATVAPHSLWSGSRFLATDSGAGPTVSVVAVMVDTAAALNAAIDNLTARIPTAANNRFVSSAGYGYTMMLEAGCAQLSTTACHVAAETPGGTLPREAFIAGSDFFTDLIPATGIAALLSAVEARQGDPRLAAGGAAFDVLGGEVDALAKDATAWVHRGALFNAQYTASWGDHASNGPPARNQHSLTTIHNTVRPYATGGAYSNYADSTLRNPQAAYWGSNLARLTEVRRTYDPNGVFTQPQGVPL